MASKEEFIRRIAPYAQQVQEKYGVPASIVIAQAAQETGWGEHVKGNNYFGIKTGSSGGPSVDMRTHEVINGKSVAIVDSFRAYSGLADSVENYGKFLAANARYNGVVNAGNAHQAANALQRAGYATDPDYARKLKAIISANNLTRFDDAKYKNYDQNEYDFERTNERLYEQRQKNPNVWDDFMTQLMTGLIEMVKSMVSGVMGVQHDAKVESPTVRDMRSPQPSNTRNA